MPFLSYHLPYVCVPGQIELSAHLMNQSGAIKPSSFLGLTIDGGAGARLEEPERRILWSRWITEQALRIYILSIVGNRDT